MTDDLIYDARDGHQWRLFAEDWDDGPWITYVAEHMGSTERLLFRVDYAAPREFHEQAAEKLKTMIAAHHESGMFA